MAKYRKSALQEMNPWTPETDMTNVSVSQPDKEAGSPKEGDMIAVSDKDANDVWLVSKQFVEDNYELVEG